MTLVDRGSVWSYLDDGSDQGTAWRELGFNDSHWATGPAELGYGDGDEATVISFGPDSGNKYVTTYYRRTLNVPDPSIYTALSMDIKRDDGVIVYINGIEVFRNNLSGTVNYATFASNGSAEENIYLNGDVDPSVLVAGNNVIAVEMHQGSGSSSDTSFDLQLDATALSPASLSEVATVIVLADGDGDGLPDDFENANGLNAADPLDAGQDPDGDNKTTIEEYISGTDFLDPNSYLKIDEIAETGVISVSFTAVAGKTYSILSSPGLSGPWTRLQDVPAQGVDGPVTVVDESPEGEQRYYRLVTPLWVP